MHEVISIVACGPSALKCGAERAPGYVVAVNSAYEHVRHDAVLTMDGRFAANHCVALHGKHFIVRERAYIKAYTQYGRWADWFGVDRFENDHSTTEFSYESGRLNGDHSGYCALNWAWQRRPKKLYLYGFDLGDDVGHFFGRYPWHGQGSHNTPGKFAKWRRDMTAAARQFEEREIRVFNTNPDSAVTAFAYGRPRA